MTRIGPWIIRTIIRGLFLWIWRDYEKIIREAMRKDTTYHIHKDPRPTAGE